MVAPAKGTTDPREIGEGPPALDRRQSCDGSAAIGNQHLAALFHVVEQFGQVLTGFADTCSAHEVIVSHVAPQMDVDSGVRT